MKECLLKQFNILMRVILGPKNDTTGGANQLANVNTA